jgi:hypothetical protein
MVCQQIAESIAPPLKLVSQKTEKLIYSTW